MTGSSREALGAGADDCASSEVVGMELDCFGPDFFEVRESGCDGRVTQDNAIIIVPAQHKVFGLMKHIVLSGVDDCIGSPRLFNQGCEGGLGLTCGAAAVAAH